MMNASRLQGIFTALPTPVHADASLHVEAADGLVAYQVRRKVSGLVPVGGTGEYGALPRRTRIQMVERCAQGVARHGGAMPVIAGILDTGYYDALAAGQEFAAAGADALMVVTPYYTNPTQAGIRDYYLRMADASSVPLVIYEIPYRTRHAIQPEILHELSRHENIIGMKACNTDMYHFLRVVAGVDPSFAVLSGEDTLLPLHLMAGAAGGVVVTATVIPQAWTRLYGLVRAGQSQQALALHRDLMPMMNMMFAETNPGPLKAVLDMIDCAAPELLCPLSPPAAPLVAALRSEMQRLFAAYPAQD